jgi:hypothetical protein
MMPIGHQVQQVHSTVNQVHSLNHRLQNCSRPRDATLLHLTAIMAFQAITKTKSKFSYSRRDLIADAGGKTP